MYYTYELSAVADSVDGAVLDDDTLVLDEKKLEGLDLYGVSISQPYKKLGVTWNVNLDNSKC